jgi:ABC-type sugar transport system permease subunit
MGRIGGSPSGGSPCLFLSLLITGCVKTFIDSFRAFTQIFVMTKGGPANASSTIVHQIYVTGFNYLRLGEASAMSFVLLVLLMIAFIPYIRMLRAESDV